jgi:hypothetical protein
MLGLGNGTFAGSPGLVLTLGLGVGPELDITPGPFRYIAIGAHQPGAMATGTHQPGGKVTGTL